MGSVRAIRVEQDPSPGPEKRRPSGLGTVTAVFLLALPPLLLFFLFGDRALVSIVADYPVLQRVRAQSISSVPSSSHTYIGFK
jgi:xyloglucan fucosyltransferase